MMASALINSPLGEGIKQHKIESLITFQYVRQWNSVEMGKRNIIFIAKLISYWNGT